MLNLPLCTTEVEKKAKKRPYEEIKVNDEGFASHSSPGEPPQVLNVHYLFNCHIIFRVKLIAVFQTADLIRSLQELENAASSDATLRQRISALPPEVQDTSLLHKVTGEKHPWNPNLTSTINYLSYLLTSWMTGLSCQSPTSHVSSNTILLVFVSDKESGERLSRLVEEACMLLADYSGRLAAEIDDRRQLTRTLAVFLQSQKDGLAKNEQKLEVGKLTNIL